MEEVKPPPENEPGQKIFPTESTPNTHEAQSVSNRDFSANPATSSEIENWTKEYLVSNNDGDAQEMVPESEFDSRSATEEGPVTLTGTESGGQQTMEVDPMFTHPQKDPSVQRVEREILTATNTDSAVARVSRGGGHDSYGDVWDRVNMRETIHRWNTWVRANPEKARQYAESHEDIRRALAWIESKANEEQTNTGGLPEETDLSKHKGSENFVMQENVSRVVGSEKYIAAVINEGPETIGAVREAIATQLVGVHDIPSLEELPVVDGAVFKDAELGLETDYSFEWASVSGVVGRPSADTWRDGWAHEYTNRKGRIDTVAEEIRDCNLAALERVFHVEKPNERIRLSAYDGPRGPLYNVEDGTHRMAGVMQVGLHEIPAMVRRVKFPFSYTEQNEENIADFKNKVRLGLIQGEVVEQTNKDGETIYKLDIKGEVLPWLHTTSQQDLVRISRIYERIYPGGLEGLPIPRDALIDPIANNYFMAGRWDDWKEQFRNNARDENGYVLYY